MQGKIVKGIAGFYYVYTALGLFECKAKGLFRKEQKKPLVGDLVEMVPVDVEKMTGNITEILPRKNTLIRPASANVDQALVIFAIVKPDPNYNLLDRFLITMEEQSLPCLICFNKQDIATEEEKQELIEAYGKSGYEVLFVSGKLQEGIDTIRERLQGKTTVVAGPSGVGKSTIINALYPQANMETGEISRKIERGKHTTRHAELFALSEDTFIFDTPGFSSLYVPGMTKESLEDCYGEFEKYKDKCRFVGCAHISEPDCAVKEALAGGHIDESRYENYKLMYNELKEKERRYD